MVGEVQGLRTAAGPGTRHSGVVIEAGSTGEFVRLDPPAPSAWESGGRSSWMEVWWSVEPGTEGLAEVRRRIQAGPPAAG